MPQNEKEFWAIKARKKNSLLKSIFCFWRKKGPDNAPYDFEITGGGTPNPSQSHSFPTQPKV